ncbi:MAG: hypothetical protein ABR526_11530 [Chthoniobacterales bacterium]
MHTSEWTAICSEADVERLLNVFGGFHDGCLREAHIWTETYVEGDLRMHCPGHDGTRVRLLFQRQFQDPSAIEMLFEQVVTFHVQPSPPNYDSIIYDAAMLLVDDIYYWAESSDWSPRSPSRDNATWIAAKKVSWRDASAWMGGELRFGTQETNET